MDLTLEEQIIIMIKIQNIQLLKLISEQEGWCFKSLIKYIQWIYMFSEFDYSEFPRIKVTFNEFIGR